MAIKKLKKAAKNFINKFPYISELYKYRVNSHFPNGHFYSPVISIENIKSKQDKIWKSELVNKISGIDLREDEQLSLLIELSSYYSEMPFKPGKQQGIRYQFENGFYSYTDGIILYSMIRHFKPKRIIEIGSGYSSAVIMDTNELYFSNQINLTCIEPYPDRLYSLMKNTDKNLIKIIDQDAQLVPLSLFETLESGDILFVDSTHVSKTGSDVNYILFDILPVLKSGVLIHFHDMFFPFEYPKDWVFQGFNWNEDYIVKAFLMYNNIFKIRLFSHYIHTIHSSAFQKFTDSYKNPGGNLWIQKISVNNQ